MSSHRRIPLSKLGAREKFFLLTLSFAILSWKRKLSLISSSLSSSISLSPSYPSNDIVHDSNHDMTCFVTLILFLSTFLSIFTPFLDLISCQSASSNQESASSSNSLQLFQLHVCHHQVITLNCPLNSVINIVLATYGAAVIGSKEEKMCSQKYHSSGW